MLTIIENDEQFLERAIQFCSKIDEVGEQLGLDPVKVRAFKSNKMFLDFAYKNREHFDEFKKDSFHEGVRILEGSFWDLIQACKSSRAYSTEIGKELGIDDITIYFENPFLPEINVEYNPDGHPKLKWDQEIFEGVEIWKDSGDRSGYKLLSRECNHEFIDGSPLPPRGECVIWKYSVGYLYKDEVIDNWRKEVHVIVHRPPER